MSLILGISEPLALENVPQVTTAIVANDFRPHHAETWIGPLADSVRECIPECRPSTAGVKLVVGFV